jgi:hypothetical protein
MRREIPEKSTHEQLLVCDSTEINYDQSKKNKRENKKLALRCREMHLTRRAADSADLAKS